jgi:type II secretory ATPase GspE/PulE/Tfp pilus assembly ATPase PilB-like protein
MWQGIFSMSDEDIKSVAAKNLLLGHGCENCYFFHGNSGRTWCDKFSSPPEEKTCEMWKQADLEEKMMDMITKGMKDMIDEQIKNVTKSVYSHSVATATASGLKDLEKLLGLDKDET